MSGPDLHTVELRRVPVTVQARSRRHHLDVVHELKLLHVASESGVVETGPELGELIERTIATHAAARDALWEAAERAEREGQTHFDVVLRLPGAVVPVAEQALRLYEEADRLCRDHQLLQLAAPPDVAEYRRWVGEELRRQIVEGASPRPCPVEPADAA